MPAGISPKPEGINSKTIAYLQTEEASLAPLHSRVEGKSFKGFAFLLRIPSFLKHFGLNSIQAFLLINPFSTPEGTTELLPLPFLPPNH